jgi:hypothetical protein
MHSGTAHKTAVSLGDALDHSACNAWIARLQAKIAGYENGISWGTTCTSCAAVLDSSVRYQREGTLIDSPGEALGFAALAGAIWPAFWLAIGVRAALHRVATAVTKPLPEETAAKTKRLERELGMGGKP